MTMTGKHRVVMVGGGFGGLNVTCGLDGADVDVTVVDRTRTIRSRCVAANGSPETAAMTTAAASNTSSVVVTTASNRPRDFRNRVTTGPPAAAPSRNPASASSEAPSENPGAPASAKPMKTTLPVMFAMNTRPRARHQPCSAAVGEVDGGADDPIHRGAGMRAVVFAGTRSVHVEDVPDAVLEEPEDI